MIKPGRTPGQSRDEAGRSEEAVATVPWQPRTDGKTARLVSERATFFDRDAPGLKPADPVEEVRDPLWDSRDGMRWTPELVDCRLLMAGEIYLRMPDRLQGGQVRSFLGNVAISPGDGRRKSPPSPMEISIADWTFERIYELPHESRQLVQARAFDASFDKIVKAMQAAGRRARKSTLIDWYRDIRRVMAADWQLRKQAIDGMTFERWREVFAKRPK